MLLGFKLIFTPLSDHKLYKRSSTNSSGYAYPRRATVGPKSILNISGSTEVGSIWRIKKRLTGNIEISPSAYDTAWVAMVPSREYSGKKPSFPQCIDWIMENQHQDGSWGLGHIGRSNHVKDSLSCTLACVLALHKWQVGQKQVQRGLDFIRSNGWAAVNKNQISPIGFNILFPGMINYAKELGLDLPLNQNLIDVMLRNRDLETIRYGNLCYVSEGLLDSCNWEKLLSEQRSNGSLFNSPATTAAALIHYKDDDKCFKYLESALQPLQRTSVPSSYPMDAYNRLCSVDTLQRLGLKPYLGHEIDNILDETYRLWQRKEEDIFADVSCLALAFRLLRMKGYEVSSDELSVFVDQDQFFNTVHIQFTSVSTILELYRASLIRIHEEEIILEKITIWTKKFLRQQLLDENIVDKRLRKQVENDLKNFHDTLERMGNRQSIEIYDMDNIRFLKSGYRCPTIDNEDVLQFSRQDFNISQPQYQKELQQLQRWYKESKLETLKFQRNAIGASHFLSTAILGHLPFSEARIAYAKTITLLTAFDDFFDHFGPKAEAAKIIELIAKWDEQLPTTFCSEEVQILFTALFDLVNDLTAVALPIQGRSIKHTLIKLWLDILTCFMSEMDSWIEENNPPSFEEYMSWAWTSIGARLCILTSIHFLGEKFPDDVIYSEECVSLCKNVAYVCRLLNDIKTHERELVERKVNSFVLIMSDKNKGSSISHEDGIAKIQDIVEQNKRQLLKMVVQNKESMFPRVCMDVFWKTCQMGVYLYAETDEFSSQKEIMKDMKDLVFDPIES